jgi:hypothetical protein
LRPDTATAITAIKRSNANGFPTGALTTQAGKPFENYCSHANRRDGSAVAVDKIDGIFDRRDLLGGIVGNFDVEFFFERHDKFDDVETVCTQIVDEACCFCNLVSFDAEMLDNDFFDPFRGIAHFLPLKVWEDESQDSP